MTTQNPDPPRKGLLHGRSGHGASEKAADEELRRVAREASTAALALLRQLPQFDEILRRATPEEYARLIKSHGEIFEIAFDIIGQAYIILTRESGQKPQLDAKAILELLKKSEAAVPNESDDSEHKDGSGKI